MLRTFVIIIVLAVRVAYLSGSSVSVDSLYLNVIIPESDTVTTDLSRYRIAANTHPDASAYINDQNVRVYPSGAFVGLVDIETGENEILISVVSPDGEEINKEFTVIRPQPLESSPEDPLVIEEYPVQPAQDQWLNTGDILEVRFKGSPGYDATFDIQGVQRGIPMQELSPGKTGGVRGIYRGTYEIKSEDYVIDVPVRFRLRKSFWSSIESESPGRVSILPEELPVVAEVKGDRPFLNVGLGTDRLGGARLGFLQPGVLLKLDGMIGSMYRVRLSGEMTAWIHSRFVDILSSNTPLPQAFAGSISTAGSPAADVVTLQLGKKLPYLTQQLTNPNRIVIDIFGAIGNTTWITQHLSADGIDNITWEQVSGEQYRLQIELKNQMHWGHKIEYTETGNMHIVIRRPPNIAENDDVLKGRIIAIDAGHGGNNKGALGATGAMEKDITLSISKILADILTSRGVSVIMTRTGDYDVSMNERVSTVLSHNPDIVVSIHANSIGYATDPERVRGTSTYYKHIGYKPLADMVYKKLIDIGLAEFGVIGSFNFLLNDLIEIPNVLVETAFLSNPEEEMLLLDDEMQKEIADAVIKGIENYLLMLN